MKALIKHASLSNLLTVCAPFAALADLIDAQRALLNGQFSEALEFAHEIADTRAVDAVCPSLVKVSEVGVQITDQHPPAQQSNTSVLTHRSGRLGL